MQRVLRYTIFGAIGGLLGWLVVEPINYLTPHEDLTMGYGQMLALGGLIGLFVGVALGVAEALSGVSPRDAVKSVVVSVPIGIVGGALGLAVGNRFYSPMHQLAFGGGQPSLFGFVLELVGRSLGWAFFGLFLGLSQGLAVENAKKLVNGAIGGLIGGGLGGFTFALLDFVNGSGVFAIPVEFMRLIGFTVTAGVIGLFIGLIEELTKQASLIHLKGRNEGREFLIFKRETYIGRDELLDVPVFGDPDVEPRHCVIYADARVHRIKDLNTVAGTMVNGQKITQPQILKDGDIIQIGMTKLKFRDKATRRIVSQGDYQDTAASRIPTSQHVCPFCGGIKDASGRCDCTVSGDYAPGAQPTVSAPSPSQYQTQPVQTDLMQTMPVSQPQNIGEAPGVPKLVGVSGPYAGQKYILDNGITIGRTSACGIALSTDNTVSRNHARVAFESGEWVIYDSGSSNGTYVNGTRVTRSVLSPGDLVQIGGTKFRFEI